MIGLKQAGGEATVLYELQPRLEVQQFYAVETRAEIAEPQKNALILH